MRLKLVDNVKMFQPVSYNTAAGPGEDQQKYLPGFVKCGTFTFLASGTPPPPM